MHTFFKKRFLHFFAVVQLSRCSIFILSHTWCACILPRPELNTVVFYYISLYALIVALKYRIQSRETHPTGNNWTWIAINLRWSSTWGNGFRSFIVFVISSICSSLFIIIFWALYVLLFYCWDALVFPRHLSCCCVELCSFWRKKNHNHEFANSALAEHSWKSPNNNVK